MKNPKERAKENATRALKRQKERQEKAQEKQRKQKIKDAIVMLNSVVKLELGASNGKVVVATMRDMKKGEKVYATAIPCLVDIPYKDFDKIRPEIKAKILSHFPQVINGSHFMSPDTLMQMYIQHDNNPNYNADTDKALRKIYKGEEITQDYKKIKGCEKLFGFIK